ncbi:MAG: hypothetical protein PVS3B3_13580 [Ktedonobacteraceae bacterium]
MSEQEEQQKNPALQDLDRQGNTDQYGQGQYDSEGKPDMHGPQAQHIQLAQTQEGEIGSSNDQVPLQDLQNQQNANR